MLPNYVALSIFVGLILVLGFFAVQKVTKNVSVESIGFLSLSGVTVAVARFRLRVQSIKLVPLIGGSSFFKLATLSLSKVVIEVDQTGAGPAAGQDGEAEPVSITNLGYLHSTIIFVCGMGLVRSWLGL
ncbi:hypothetical protein HDU91_002576, partial [Kappamyces sp. JEL0680]